MYQLYIDYFKYLCGLHPSLAHTDSNKVFEVISVEDAFSDYRGKVSPSGFFFRLLDYSWGVDDVGSFTFQKKQGGFIVGKKIAVRSDTAEARITARNQVETICNDFITHMLADSRNGHPLFSHNQDELSQLKLNVSPHLVTGDGSYDGLVVTFDFSPEYNYELGCHPVPAWQELSPLTYEGADPPDPTAGGFWQLNAGGNWQGNE